MKKISSILFSFVLVFSFLPLPTRAASFSFSPAGGSYQVGKPFSVSFFINTEGKVMNAASGTVSFPTSLLEVTSVSKMGSIFSLWVQEPSFSNTNGTVNFEGLVLNPGFSGSSGKVITVNFKPKKEGSATVKYTSGAVLANDGLGTNLVSTFNTATYVLEPSVSTAPTTSSIGVPKITSSTHSDSDSWYNSSTATFDWDLPSNVLETRILIGRNEKSTPTVSYTPPISTKTIDDLGGGSYYFSVQFRTAEGWGVIGRFKINIDTVAPSSFNIVVNTEEENPRLSFQTDDTDSGFSHYELTVGDGELIRIEEQDVSLYELGFMYLGEQIITVTAFDNAGNSTQDTISVVFSSPDFTKPIITNYPESIEQGGMITIEGTATPNTSVILEITKKDALVIQQEGMVNAQGQFTFVVSSKLGLGNHVATVTTTSQEKQISLTSSPVVLKVNPIPLIAFAITFLSYLAVALLVVVGLATFIKVLMYFTHDLFRTFKFLSGNSQNEAKNKNEIRSPLKIDRKNINKKKFF